MVKSKTIQVSGFPSHVTANQAREFIEGVTGEGTIYALKLRPPKNGGSRSFAIVQFTAAEHAEAIVQKANNPVRLWFGRNYLQAREMERDIIPKPRTILHNLQNVVMHFGCQVSKDKFSVLWRSTNVSVDFGIGLRKLNFYVPYGLEYRLQLSYENVWQIELHRPRGPISTYLLIQVCCYFLRIYVMYRKK